MTQLIVQHEGAKAALLRFADELDHGAAQVLVTGLRAAEMFAKGEPQAFKAHTGRLKRSISARLLTPRRGKLTATAPYAQYVEYGRGPVRPVRAKWLRFKIGGHVIFTKYCRPAQQRPFIRPAAARAEITMRNSAEAMVNVAARKV